MPDGVVFNIQKYSLHDGPGIRTTVFLKGCPLHCWWCHNPESQTPDLEITRSESRCVRCDQCLEACPQRSGANTADSTDSGDCLRCGACVEACPTEARQWVGRRMTVPHVLDTVLQDRIFYDESGGGVTFSGGEPLMQPEFLAGLLAACRDAGLHTAIDTCGFAPREQLLELAGSADLILYDLKTVDDQLHRQFTGASNQVILDNLRALGAAHRNIWIRVPVIPGHNDDRQHIEAVARFVSETRGVTQVNLLPYHGLHRHKTQQNDRPGKTGKGQDVEAPTTQHLTDLAKLFRERNLRTEIGG